MSLPPLEALLDSWMIYLHAERKAQGTLRSYQASVRAYLDWCTKRGRRHELSRRQVAEFIADLLADGREASTATARLTGLKAFARWLADPDDGEGISDEIAGLRPPRIDVKVVPTLTDDDLRALIAACRGNALRDRRDEAIVRLMVETGARAGEVIGLKMADLDLRAGSVVIRRGKGGKGRTVPIGPATSRAIDRYLRLRRAHSKAGGATLWLGDGGRSFSYAGLAKSLRWRAARAGLVGFHPHVLRHTAASRWLAAGGSEGGLMSLAGWSRQDLIHRYTAANRARLMADEARRLGLGESY